MNSFYNFSQGLDEKHTEVSFFNEIIMQEPFVVDDFTKMEIARQQTRSILKLEQLSLGMSLSQSILAALKSKLCCFVENLYYSEKYSFSQISIKVLREDSLYIVLNGEQELSFNLFVDDEDIEEDYWQKENEEEVFLTYKKNGKECITCDSIPNIFSIIETL